MSLEKSARTVAKLLMLLSLLACLPANSQEQYPVRFSVPDLSSSLATRTVVAPKESQHPRLARLGHGAQVTVKVLLPFLEAGACMGTAFGGFSNTFRHYPSQRIWW